MGNADINAQFLPGLVGPTATPFITSNPRSIGENICAWYT